MATQKPIVTTQATAHVHYAQLLTDDKPKEAGEVAYALGLLWRHNPYNMKGSKAEDRDQPRSQLWLMGWNTAKAKVEGAPAQEPVLIQA